MHVESVTQHLWRVLKILSSIPELQPFRLVGGTALSLQIGHRKSIDIDLFPNEKTDNQRIRSAINKEFKTAIVNVKENSLSAELDGVKVDIYGDWHIPFKTPPGTYNNIRMASLHDIAAFKLSAITNRRHKMDYIDLYFLFNILGMNKVLNDFKKYEPLMSERSIIFALAQSRVAQENKSQMPDMITAVSWDQINTEMMKASRLQMELAKRKEIN